MDQYFVQTEMHMLCVPFGDGFEGPPNPPPRWVRVTSRFGDEIVTEYFIINEFSVVGYMAAIQRTRHSVSWGRGRGVSHDVEEGFGRVHNRDAAYILNGFVLNMHGQYR